MPHLVQAVCEANTGRDPQGLRLKLRKLRQDPFAFLRGTCQRYYQAMPEPGWTGGAPVGWICGDLHLENFGAYRSSQGKARVDINDFDAAQKAPLSWDVLRLLSSLRLACRERGWGVTCRMPLACASWPCTRRRWPQPGTHCRALPAPAGPCPTCWVTRSAARHSSRWPS